MSVRMYHISRIGWYLQRENVLRTKQVCPDNKARAYTTIVDLVLWSSSTSVRVIHKKYMIGANNTSSIRLSGDISYHGNNETQAGAGMCQAQCKIRLFFIYD